MAQEAEIKELYTILKGILHNDNTVRLQAEAQLKQYLVIPQKLLLYLVRLMQISEEDYIRKLSSVLFKHYIALEEVSSMWNNIEPAQQELIKKELLEALRKELNPKVSRQVCQAVAELASLIFSQDKQWPELEELIMTYTKSNDLMVETAFRILGTLFALNSDRYMKNVPALCSILDTAFQRTATNALMAASMALCTLVAEIDTSETKPFQKYSPYVINTIAALFNEGNEDGLHEFIDAISEVAESEPTFFRKSFAQLCDVLIKVSGKKDYDNEKLRQMPLEMLVSIIERLPGLAKKFKTQLWNLCAAVFDVTVSIDEDVDEAWLKPKEGYNIEEDLNPDDNVNFGVIAFDRLLGSLEDDQIFPIIEKVVETSMTSPDWRYRNSGLMIIGQIGEYCESTDRVKNVVPILVSHISHPHPKVRFAALYAVGLLSDYMYPEFQEEFHTTLIPPMINAIDDPVPRVQSHACAALTNFLEHVKQSVAAEVAPVLLPKLIKGIREGISIMKENAMTCISSIAESAAEDFLKYYDELMPFLFECVKQLTAREYHQFRGQTIECLTIMSAAVGHDSFVKYAPTLIELMVSLQEAELTKDDPQRFYLLGAWQRICLILEKEFAAYLPRVVPGLLKIAGAMPGMGVSSGLKTGSLESILREVSGSTSGKLELSTSEIEEKEMALQMLQVFCVQLEEKYAPYVEETTRIVEPVLTFGPNSELRKEGAAILPNLLQCLKKAQIPAEHLITAGSRFIADLLTAHDKETHAEVKSSQVLALKDVYETMEHFMSPADTKVVIAKILSFFKDSQDRKSAILSHKEAAKDEEEPEEEEEEGEEEDNIEMEDDYQKNLTYFLGAVVSTHKDEALSEVPTIISGIVQPYLTGNKNAQRVALFIVDDLAEYLGVEKLGATLWKQLASIILTYATRAEHELRQAACYGIGSLAKSGGAAFAEIAVQCLTTLGAAIEVKEDKKHHEEWAAARDNAVSSIGKIMKYQPTGAPVADLWPKWLRYLPIKEDKPEAKFAHEFVVDTLLANPEAAIGAGGALLGDIIRIFIGVYDNKLVSKAARGKISQALKQLSGHAAIVPMLEDIYKNKLKAGDKEVLEKILKAGN